MTLPYLSVKQPWASLLIASVKRCENRTWTTKYRGWLGIHASKQPEPDWEGLREEIIEEAGVDINLLPHIRARGEVIGACYLADSFHEENAPDIANNYFLCGPQCLWMPIGIALPIAIPMRGNTGIRPLPQNISAALLSLPGVAL
jgi:hypothetical protein